MNVLVLNAGSSTLKFQLIATDAESMERDQDRRLCRGHIERIGGEALLILAAPGREPQRMVAQLRGVPDALDQVVRWIVSQASGVNDVRSLADIQACGHRVVHGGERFSESVPIDDEVVRAIEDCFDLAPLHNPANLNGILAARELFGPDLPQVAVFDTAFYHSIPERAFLYGIPYHLYRRYHIRRYGFHGTSHRYIAERYRRFRRLSPEQTNVISLHLGNGCSATAIHNGLPVDTSMGMTPLEGLMMGTRSGDIDPAIITTLCAKEGLSPHEVETMLNTQSGLLGVSGLTNDMRVLQQEVREHDDRRARIAIEIFCYRTRKYIGALLASMGGADAILFTGGIGENCADVRARICRGLEWAGLQLDEAKNEALTGTEGLISAEPSTLRAYVIPTDEELLIARDTARIVGARRASGMPAALTA